MNGEVLGSTKILDNGPDERRVNLVLVGEGYRRQDLGEFRRRCAEFVRVIQSEPWYERVGSETLNIHRVDVISDQPATWLRNRCPGNRVRSFFTAQFCGNSRLRRYISGNSELVRDVVGRLVPSYTCAGVLVNSRHYGGAAVEKVFWTATGPRWTQLARHEMGHSLFLLADEYDGERGSYNDDEPSARNITIETNRERLKWRDLTADSTRIPTWTVDEGLRQERVLRKEVGLFEGAARFSREIYRGAETCLMREFEGPFCPVCEEAIVDMLSERLDDGQPGIPATSTTPESTSTSTTSLSTPVSPLVSPGGTRRISITVGGRTVEFEDSEAGTLRAIDFLSRRIGD